MTAVLFLLQVNFDESVRAIQVDFPADDVNVKIGGSGNCWVNSVKNLVAKLAGSGNVIYKGNPLVDSTILGSGNVRKE